MSRQPWNLRAGLGFAATASELGLLAEARQVAMAMNRRRPGAAVRAALAELSLNLGHAREAWTRSLPSVLRGPALHHAAVLAAVASLRWSGPGGALSVLGNLGGAPGGSLHLGYPEQDAHLRRLTRLISAVAPHHGARMAWEGMRHAVASGAAAEIADYLAVIAAIDSAQGSRNRALAFGREARWRSIVAGDRRGVYVSLAQASDASAERVRLPAICDALDGTTVLLRFDYRLQQLASLWSDGQLEQALTAYEVLVADPEQERSPILEVRFAEVAAPLLRFLGRWSSLDEALDRGTRAARLLGRSDVASRLELSRISALRASGRRSEAVERLVTMGDAPRSAELETRIWLERARLAASGGRRAEMTAHLRRARTSASDGSDSARTLVALTSLEIAGTAAGASNLQTVGLGSAASVAGVPAPLAQAAIDAVVSENSGARQKALQAYARAETALAAWISEVDDVSTRLSALAAWEGLGRRRARLELDAGRWAAGLEALDRSRSSIHDEPPVKLAHLQTHLSDDSALLSFRFLEDEVWAWRAGPGEVQAMRLTASAAEVRDAASLWIESVSTARPNTSWQRLGSRLAVLTMHQVEAAGWLDGLQTLIVLPGGGLDSLPLDSLPSLASAPRFYGDEIVFARSRTISDLDRALHRKPRGSLAVAFLPSGGGAAIPEVEGVLLRDSSRAFVGADATESAFVVHAPMSRLIHFGGHSVPPNVGVDAGGLSLRATASHNGFLSFAEIAALDLEGATVVLFGCDTARTTVVGSGGRGGLPTSLADAFMVAGSRNVVGSLWPLNERTAGELGKLFYLAGGPESGAASLATAKRMLRQRHPAEPFRWAGAVWQGAPGGVE